MNARVEQEREVFHLILIKPTHYDDQGYPIQWWRSLIPSNSLACLNGIALDCKERRVLGDHVEIRITAADETNSIVRRRRILDEIQQVGGKALLALVGVQSNQFPRAVDLAKEFIEAGVPVCMGGFHVAGSLAMLPGVPPEISAAQDLGISMFAGEAEDHRFDQVLRDAYKGELPRLYDFVNELPDLGAQPLPFLEPKLTGRTHKHYGSIDLGRGCPFNCSFCTIINVQGRVSRFRTADDFEAIIRKNAALGLTRFFITDDNLARNKNWEAFFDRLIDLKESEGLEIRMFAQVDMLCHKVPGFIDKAARAGVDQLFVGLENINPDNLVSANKKQNRITEYRKMLLGWKKYPVVITAGYIIGFPNDTRESILNDIDIIKKELPIDLIYFNNLTLLPGCEDHKKLHAAGVWMDSDLNNYDLNHHVTRHQRMTDQEWSDVYQEVWARFYTFDHMETILRRTAALGSNKKLTTINRMTWFKDFLRLCETHPLESGFIRYKVRGDRRPGLPEEGRVRFYLSYAAYLTRSILGMGLTYLRLRRIVRKVWTDPKRLEYKDTAITPTSDEELDELELFGGTRGGEDAVRKVRRLKVLATG